MKSFYVKNLSGVLSFLITTNVCVHIHRVVAKMPVWNTAFKASNTSNDQY